MLKLPSRRHAQQFRSCRALRRLAILPLALPGVNYRPCRRAMPGRWSLALTRTLAHIHRLSGNSISRSHSVPETRSLLCRLDVCCFSLQMTSLPKLPPLDGRYNEHKFVRRHWASQNGLNKPVQAWDKKSVSLYATTNFV